jgi:hypothetical protein
MVKVCTKCKIEKDYSEFSKDKLTKDGLRSNCKSCCKEYYQANKEIIKEYHKEYNKANKEYRNERAKEYHQANKERINESKKEYRKANKEYYKEYHKEYYQANKEKMNEISKEYSKEWQRERRKTDPLFKIKCNLRTRTCKAFKNKGYSKTSKTQEMLGVDWEVAKQHIERQFTKGMNWDNQGEWHIDHIIPLASANNEEELKKLCHYSNLQPLWAEDNLEKSAKIIGQQNKLRI